MLYFRTLFNRLYFRNGFNILYFSDIHYCGLSLDEHPQLYIKGQR